jgi:hypothetical protein
MIVGAMAMLRLVPKVEDLHLYIYSLRKPISGKGSYAVASTIDAADAIVAVVCYVHVPVLIHR